MLQRNKPDPGHDRTITNPEHPTIGFHESDADVSDSILNCMAQRSFALTPSPSKTCPGAL
jgi:hypothetical protein